MKRKLLTLTLVFVLSNSVLAQDVQKKEDLLSFEIGVGYNDVQDNKLWKGYPKSNAGLILAVEYSRQKKGSLLRLGAGLRYQRRGVWETNNAFSVKTNNMLVPMNLEFHLFDRKRLGLYIKVGTGLEFNLTGSSSGYLKPKRVMLNNRIGIGATLFNTSRKRIGLQVVRTLSSTSYVGKKYSPGGFGSDEKYKFEGLEVIIRMICKMDWKKT